MLKAFSSRASGSKSSGGVNVASFIVSFMIRSTAKTRIYSDKKEVIESLTDAIFRQRTCLVEYHSLYCKLDTLAMVRILEKNKGPKLTQIGETHAPF